MDKEYGGSGGSSHNHNHGCMKKGDIRQDFGLDRSSYAGSAAMERDIKMVGSATNLSHSLSGVSAKQDQNRGKKSGLD